jgi:hypothetical protein
MQWRTIDGDGGKQRSDDTQSSASDEMATAARRARSRDTIDEPRMVDGGDESEDEFGGAGGRGVGGLGDRTGVG